MGNKSSYAPPSGSVVRQLEIKPIFDARQPNEKLKEKFSDLNLLPPWPTGLARLSTNLLPVQYTATHENATTSTPDLYQFRSVPPKAHPYSGEIPNTSPTIEYGSFQSCILTPAYALTNQKDVTKNQQITQR